MRDAVQHTQPAVSGLTRGGEGRLGQPGHASLVRGGYAALVFCGSAGELGESAGMWSWRTRHKFALAADSGLALPVWGRGAERAVAGVCYVFADAGHPALGALESSGARDGEDFFVLSRRYDGFERERVLGGVLASAGKGASVGVLGYGEQGVALVGLLREKFGVAGGRLFVHDADAVVRGSLRDEQGIRTCADPREVLVCDVVVSTPTRTPGAFEPVLAAARAAGKGVFENASVVEERRELVPRGVFLLSEAVDRLCEAEGDTLGVREGSVLGGLGIDLAAVRIGVREIGGVRVPAVGGWERVRVGAGTAVVAGAEERVCVGIDGQTNHHDAGLCVFAAKEAVRGSCGGAWARVVDRAMPSSTLSEMDRGTSLERHLARTPTGRTIGAPFQTAAEQTVLALCAAGSCDGRGAGDDDDGAIVELGSATGGSAVLMAIASGGRRGPRVYSVDVSEEMAGSVRAVFDFSGVGDRLVQLTMTTREAFDELGHLRGKAGLVFIDAMHTYDDALWEYRNYRELVRAGGLIAFHDVQPRFEGVVRACVDGPIADGLSPVVWADSLLVFEKPVGG